MSQEFKIRYINWKGNVLERLIKLYFHLPWDWEELSCNPNISIEFIENHIYYPWISKYLSCNPNMTVDFVNRHQYLDWDFLQLFRLPQFNTDRKFYEKYRHKLTDEYILTTIPIETCEKYLKTIDYSLLSTNQYLTIDYVVKNLRHLWDWKSLSKKVVITWFDSSLPWDYSLLSYNEGITEKIVNDNILESWNWDVLLSRPNISLKFIRKYRHKIGTWKYISHSYNITPEFIYENKDKDWCWYTLSSNPVVTRDLYSRLKDKPWNLRQLSNNSGIKCDSAEFLQPKFPRNVSSLSSSNFMFEDPVFLKFLRHDIEQRRVKVTMDLCSDIKKYILKYYIGYD